MSLHSEIVKIEGYTNRIKDSGTKLIVIAITDALKEIENELKKIKNKKSST